MHISQDICYDKGGEQTISAVLSNDNDAGVLGANLELGSGVVPRHGSLVKGKNALGHAVEFHNPRPCTSTDLLVTVH